MGSNRQYRKVPLTLYDKQFRWADKTLPSLSQRQQKEKKKTHRNSHIRSKISGDQSSCRSSELPSTETPAPRTPAPTTPRTPAPTTPTTRHPGRRPRHPRRQPPRQHRCMLSLQSFRRRRPHWRDCLRTAHRRRQTPRHAPLHACEDVNNDIRSLLLFLFCIVLHK